MAVRMSRERRRQQIIETAIQVFADSGFRGTTTKSIASAAGVSEATVFSHFSTKEDVYNALLHEAIQAQEPMLQELDVGPEVRLEDALCRIAEATLTRSRRDQAILRLLFYSALEEHSLGKKFFQQHLRGPFRKLVKLLERHLRSDDGRCVDAEIAARAFLGMLMYEIITHELFHVGRPSRRSVDRVVHEFVGTYLNGVQPSVRRP